MPARKETQMQLAKMLFLDQSNKLTRKEIAERVGVRQNTVGDWIKKYNWEKQKKSLLLTKNETIADLLDQLNLLTNHIKSRDIIYDVPVQLLKPVKVKDSEGNESLENPDIDESKFPIKVSNYPTSKEANQIAVLTSAIKKLETDLSIAETIDASREFLEWLKQQDFDLHKKMIPFFDSFIQSKL